MTDPDVFISAESGCFSNADLDPALKTCKQTPNEDFSVVEKDKKRLLKSRKPSSWFKVTYNSVSDPVPDGSGFSADPDFKHPDLDQSILFASIQSKSTDNR